MRFKTFKQPKYTYVSRKGVKWLKTHARGLVRDLTKNGLKKEGF
jgi:hypothetical protein